MATLASQVESNVQVIDAKAIKQKGVFTKFLKSSGFTVGRFQELYSLHESYDHEYISHEERGIFGKNYNEPFTFGNSFSNFIWRLCIHFEMLYLFTNKTIWDVTVFPICLYISRRIAGVFEAPYIKRNGLPQKGFKASGYYGWGKSSLLSKDEMVSNFKSEITNLSIVAALFLTITLSILTSSSNYEFLDTDVKKFFFVMLCGTAVTGQLMTATVALSIMTNVNKCVGKEASMYFVLSIFNPYNGITGIIGPALYLGAIFSWAMTIYLTVFLVFLNFGDTEAGNGFSVLYLFVILTVFFVYIIALIYGTHAEINCSKIDMLKVENMSLEGIKAYANLNSKKNSVISTEEFDVKSELANTYKHLSADDAKLLLSTLSDT